ncbi:helix-turn-helix domain-containing protein [Streptomyces cavernae]|uniref:helix-turn-helix domain-containing protein n=1 Tax=Streptomyces cavernae TaxID=2259034 RepID=UPI000FEB758D|nr:helix-turn-helix domain-containing protein [Streptomyces cavernae]
MPQGSSQQGPTKPHRAKTHRVLVIVDESTNPFEVGVATELFGLPRPELDLPGPLYELTLCTPAPDVRMNHGFFVMTGAPGLEAVEDADTLIVPGRPDNVVPRAPAVLDAVRYAHARGTRIVSFCTGSFALAEAGLLDGRRATTHWRWVDEFRSLHPKVLLEPDVLYVDEGEILTAAGSAAALDLGLYLIRRDHGAEIANSVSRRLVFAAHRDGGQRQFVERPVPDVPDESLAPLLAWAQERLGEPLTVADLASRAAVSPATLHRRFRAQLGTTPLAWLTGERVALACRLIERGETRLDVVAQRCGLGTAANLRNRLRRETGLTPSSYRRRFGLPA